MLDFFSSNYFASFLNFEFSLQNLTRCFSHNYYNYSMFPGCSGMFHAPGSIDRRPSQELKRLWFNESIKIRDATASRTRWPIKNREKNAVVCAGKVKRRRGCETLFISVILQHFFRRNSHGIIWESPRNRRDHRRGRVCSALRRITGRVIFLFLTRRMKRFPSRIKTQPNIKPISEWKRGIFLCFLTH